MRFQAALCSSALFLSLAAAACQADLEPNGAPLTDADESVGEAAEAVTATYTLGQGSCRGAGWNTTAGWPRGQGYQTPAACQARCDVTIGCTGYDLARPQGGSYDCALFGHSQVVADGSADTCYAKIIPKYTAGQGSCRGAGWNTTSGWPKGQGYQTPAACEALCDATAGCTGYDLARPQGGSYDCALFGHSQVVADGSADTCFAKTAPSASSSKIKLYNTGLGKYVSLFTGSVWPFPLRFDASGQPMRMEETSPGSHVYTFTIDYTPGTCSDGYTRSSCVDSYRLCAADQSGFRWYKALSSGWTGTPSSYGTSECQWTVEDAGGGDVHLRNQSLPPYVSYLNCWTDYDCVFTYYGSTSGNVAFRLIRSP